MYLMSGDSFVYKVINFFPKEFTKEIFLNHFFFQFIEIEIIKKSNNLSNLLSMKYSLTKLPKLVL